MTSSISDLLKPLLTAEGLIPCHYDNNHDNMAQGMLSLGINTENMHTKGATYTFGGASRDLREQVHTEGLENSLMLRDFIEFQEQDVDQQLSDNLMQSILSRHQKEVPSNKQQLREIERVIISIVENNEITIGNFSENSLTNANTYNHLGLVEEIGYVRVPTQNKRYTSEDVYNKMPHPIHQKKRRRLQKEQILEPKSKEDILSQFQILSGMFTFGNVQEDETNYQKVLDVIDFQDASYDSLWQDILDRIDLSKDTTTKTKAYKVKSEVADDRFRETVEKVIKEAEEYEKEIQDEMETERPLEQQDEEDTPQQEEPATEQEQKQPTQEPLETFKSIKISPNSGNQINKQRYPFAVEDTSDLTNFYDILPKEKFAMQYPFELDEFQKRSILHLEKKETVFVCAHTSAGKTVVAEYGIALAIKHKRKVIYTSPIKALSNQKYRQFTQKFDSVGIVTGDISMNQDANCVIMTTEILANQLYKGADMIRDIEWVIFDEVHYINNPERGVVWEETIIMLPEHIGIIMLSATVPNYMEFANWVGRTKRRTVFVMKTFHRPVPLEHSMYIFDKFHVIKEATGRFLMDEYKDMLKEIHKLHMTQEEIKDQKKADKKKKIEERGFYKDNKREQALKMQTQKAVNKFIKNVSQDDMKRHKDRQESRMVSQLIADCKEKKLLPCVIFCFSKRKIQELAENIYTTKLTTNQEAGEVFSFFQQALQNLKPEDKDLTQFRFLFEIAKNGYAIHHGDLMPLAKEIVELLFSRGLIKVLLATETFAMGINMPTKTVIFHSTRKVDGPDGRTRFLNSSEYVQMSGRAGRRGLDQKGTVIIMVKDPDALPESNVMMKMIDNPGEPLISKFRVTYKTILNLYSSREINAEEMMRQSFYEDPKFSVLPSHHQQIRNLKAEYDLLSEIDCPYNQLKTRLLIQEYMTSADKNRDFDEIQFSEIEPNKLGLPKYGLILDHSNEFHKCIVLKIDRERESRYIQILTIQEIDTEFYLTRKEMEEAESTNTKKRKIVLEYENSKAEKIETSAIPDTKNKFHYYVRWVKPSELVDLYSNKITNEKNMVLSKTVYEELARKLMAVPDKLTSLVREEYYTEEKRNELKTMTELKCHNCEFKAKHTYQNTKRRKVKAELLALMGKVDRSQLSLLGDYKSMAQLLEELQFISKDSILLKGKIAREVDIFVTEILVEGVLEPLKEEEIASLLTAFVNQFKPRVKPKEGKQDLTYSPFNHEDTYTPALAHAIDRTHEIVSKMVDIEYKYNELIDNSKEQRILNTINFYLCGAIYQWSLGVDFAQIADHQEVPEGTLVRTIMRLDILLRNVKSGCMIIGNTTLGDKVTRASEMIKRDIVFTQSLYLAE